MGAIWSNPSTIEFASVVKIVADAPYMRKEDLRRALIDSNFRPLDPAIDPNLPFRWMLEQVLNCTNYVRVLFLKEYGTNFVGKSIPVCFCRVFSTCSTVAYSLQGVLKLSECFEELKREMIELFVHLNET
ncbi:hypothetical protein LJR232_001479 [Aquipseudomonas alcaligenes]